MDISRFDALTQHLVSQESRRGFLAGLVAVVFGGIQPSIEDAAAKKHKKHKKKKKKSPPSSPPPLPLQPTCTGNCDGRVCGDDGCGGSCGTCSGGSCSAAGQCVCPFGSPCSPGVCCANGQTCIGSTCATCSLGSTPCTTQICGRTPGGQACACVTGLEGPAAHCVNADPSKVHCFDCANDAACEAAFPGLPGGALCIGGVTCPGGCSATDGKACMPRACVDG
jgi:hypothetical protein